MSTPRALSDPQRAATADEEDVRPRPPSKTGIPVFPAACKEISNLRAARGALGALTRCSGAWRYRQGGRQWRLGAIPVRDDPDRELVRELYDVSQYRGPERAGVGLTTGGASYRTIPYHAHAHEFKPADGQEARRAARGTHLDQSILRGRVRRRRRPTSSFTGL
jgi:hypothetical protein